MRSENGVEKFLGAILPICWKGNWITVDEMAELTQLHPSTIRWAMKQLRTGKEGDFIVRKRIRQPLYKGKHEYYIKRKPAQIRMRFDEPAQHV